MENEILIGVHIVGVLGFFIAAFVEDIEPKTAGRIALLVFVSSIWPIAILSMLFMWLMSKK